MLTVSFVCLGNICRSPMAEAIFKRICKEMDYEADILSFGTSDCEAGNGVYPPVARLLSEKGYDFAHKSRQISKKDIINSDYILVMDSDNLWDILRMAGPEFEYKVFKLGSFLTPKRDIADPWYTRDFEKAYNDIYAACEGLYVFLQGRDPLNAINYRI